MSTSDVAFKKVSVNLLPPEILLQRKHDSKLIVANKLSILVLIILIFFTSATIALRLAQNNQLQSSREALASAQNVVTGLGSKEESLLVLKQRLGQIDTLLGEDTKRKSMFNMLVSLTPSDVGISEVSVDKNGAILASFNSFSLPSVETFLEDMTDSQNSSDLIKKIDLEGFSLSKGNVYRFSLRIMPK